MDGFSGEGLLVCATNHHFLLDPAVWRRFDEICYFDRPDEEARRRLVKKFLGGFRHEAAAAEKIATLNGRTGGELEQVCMDAIKHAILQGRSTLLSEDLRVSLDRLNYRDSVARLGDTTGNVGQNTQDDAPKS